MAMGARRGARWDLSAPAVPQWEAPFKEVAPSGVALWGGDLGAKRRHPPRSRAFGGSRRSAQPLRARGAPLDRRINFSCYSADACVHPRFGGEPDLALPAFWGRAKRADQVDSLRRLGGRRYVPYSHGYLVHLPVGSLGGSELPAVVGSIVFCGAAELRGSPRGGGFSRLEVPPLRHRRGHKPHPRLRNPHGLAGSYLLRRCDGGTGDLPHADRPGAAAPTSRGRFYPPDRGTLHPPEAPHPVLHRQALLPP